MAGFDIGGTIRGSIGTVNEYNEGITEKINEFNNNEAELAAVDLRQALLDKNILTSAYSKVIGSAEQTIGKLLA